MRRTLFGVGLDEADTKTGIKPGVEPLHRSTDQHLRIGLDQSQDMDGDDRKQLRGDQWRPNPEPTDQKWG
jgi:hypothetical protein